MLDSQWYPANFFAWLSMRQVFYINAHLLKALLYIKVDNFTAAQEAADLMVRAGITSILNFAPVVIATPRAVRVRKVDLASELQILSYYEQMRTEQIDGAKSQSKSSAVSV